MQRSLVLVLLVLGACKPRGVDPEADFTLRGRLVQANGAPAANTEVRIFKVNYWDASFFVEDSFLHVPTIEAQDGLQDIFRATTNSFGDYELVLKGKDVNAIDGSAGYLSAVHTAPGVYNATATDWHRFTDAEPVWDAGNLRLWDAFGTTAVRSNNTVSFDWSANPTSDGYEEDGYRPYFLFAYDAASPVLQWGEHTSSTVASIPRGAFEGTGAPEFFIVGYAREVTGSREYFVRSPLMTVTGWAADPTTGYIPSEIRDSNDAFIDTDGAVDAEYATLITGRPTEIIADFGSVTAFRDILFYGLGVVGLRDATVFIESSSDGNAPWSLIDSYSGERNFENWVYVGATGAFSGRYFRARVEGRLGSQPYFIFLDEIVGRQ